MDNIQREAGQRGLNDTDIRRALASALKSAGKLNRVLIIPPDITRYHSYAGPITRMLFEMLDDARVDILPALGTHTPMTAGEIADMYAGVPAERFFNHGWRDDVVKLGELSAGVVEDLSEGLFSEHIDVEVNRRIVDPGYDLVISVGQIVPHEVAGMSGYTKNILVGCGGPAMINKSHYLGALYGIENILGTRDNPVRRLFDDVEARFLKDLPMLHIMTVMTRTEDKDRVEGLFVGRGNDLYAAACDLSLEKNVTRLPERQKKIVVYLDPREFKSTWLGNKAVYRTRLAMADGGELVIIAPGVRSFGEDRDNDALIRRYGYRSAPEVRKLVEEHRDLAENLSAAAHLIHGSSDGRFEITYAPGGLSREEVESAGYRYMSPEEALTRYRSEERSEGYHTAGGEEFYLIRNPALGLWMV